MHCVDQFKVALIQPPSTTTATCDECSHLYNLVSHLLLKMRNILGFELCGHISVLRNVSSIT